MVNIYNNLSPATKLLIQSFLAVLGSVLAGVAVAAYQSYTNAGTMDLQALLNICLVTFALLFAKAMHDWVPAHAQEMLKATQEEKKILYEALQRQQNISTAVMNNSPKPIASELLHAQPQPIVVQTQPTLTPEHIQQISQQIALNLTNMAAGPAKVEIAKEKALEGPAPYEDPLKVSAVLPAYTPQEPFPGQAV